MISNAKQEEFNMMPFIRVMIVAWLVVLFPSRAHLARADVILPHVLGHHMVLQRGMPVPVWGRAAPGEEVTVRIGSHEAATKADEAGAWMVTLPAMQAGGPFEMVLRGRNTIVLEDILIGEVWICSGQSNMEMGIGVVENGAKEAAAADHPRIRLFELPRNPAGEPRPDVNAAWRVCRPDNIAEGRWGGFSAVGYFFGREIHEALDVPVGLIDTCWGGTLIAPWTPICGFAAIPAVRHYIDVIETKDKSYKSSLPGKLEEMENWIAATRKALSEGTLLPPALHWPKHPLENPDQHGSLFNGMIHPLVPFAIRGAVWYQGESNVHARDGMMYFEKMKALIHGWREVWGQGDFPFYYVQIAPFKYHWHRSDLEPDQVPKIWEAQTAALAIPNTGMAVTTDISNLRDIHPGNKLDVGRRLALWALAKTYEKEGLVYSGPLYTSMEIEDNKVRLRFKHVGSGLASRNGEALDWFEIAGDDRTFFKARAEIENGTVVAWSEKVHDPVAVRFGWHQEAEPNLMNREGLPASPFRTDDW